ncbi:MAG: hypothetical protein AAFY48_01315 [Bacteroidota bacterium]
MSTYKIIVSALVGIPLCLLILALFIKQPHVTYYEQAVSELLTSGQFRSEAEILEHYPELAEVKSQMQQEAHLSAAARAKFCSPLPPVSIAEQQEMVAQLQLSHHLRTRIKNTLHRFTLDVVVRVVENRLQR